MDRCGRFMGVEGCRTGVSPLDASEWSQGRLSGSRDAPPCIHTHTHTHAAAPTKGTASHTHIHTHTFSRQAYCRCSRFRRLMSRFKFGWDFYESFTIAGRAARISFPVCHGHPRAAQYVAGPACAERGTGPATHFRQFLPRRERNETAARCHASAALRSALRTAGQRLASRGRRARRGPTGRPNG